MRDREAMIFACLARRAAHLARTCMFDMSSMAGGTTSTVSDGERRRGCAKWPPPSRQRVPRVSSKEEGNFGFFPKLFSSSFLVPPHYFFLGQKVQLFLVESIF